jgi:probable rRNA maturation factor
MNRVQVACRGIRRPRWIAGVGRFCRATLHELAIDGWELSVLLAGDDTVRELNRGWRGIDAPTDVLSFSQTEGVPVPRGAPRTAAGDIVISLPAAERQAAAAGVPVEQELRRLLVHGILHLKGMDHGAGSVEMIPLQEALLERLEERLF